MKKESVKQAYVRKIEAFQTSDGQIFENTKDAEAPGYSWSSNEN